MANQDASHIEIPATESDFGDKPSAWPNGSFVDRIVDTEVREKLALHVSTNGFYGLLDRGKSIDDALNLSMALAIDNKKFLDSFVEIGRVPSTTWPESSWHNALDEALAGERPSYEPGRIRKWLAKTILRQEVQTKKYTVDLTPWRKRGQTSASGII